MYQCTGSGTTRDSCLDVSLTGLSSATPYCSTGASHAGSSNTVVGMCGPCQKSNGMMGDNNSIGSCTDSQQHCLTTGECKCRVCETSGGITTCNEGDNTKQGTCSTGVCCTNGACKATEIDCLP